MTKCASCTMLQIERFQTKSKPLKAYINRLLDEHNDLQRYVNLGRELSREGYENMG